MVAPSSRQFDNQYTNLLSADVVGSVEALRTLKNDLIGHLDRKRQAIQSGLVSNLATILCSNTGSEDLKVQAAIILASLCQPDLLPLDYVSDHAHADSWQAEGRQTVAALLQCIANPASSPALTLPCLRALNALVLAGADATNLWLTQLPTLTVIIQAAAASTTKLIVVQQAIQVASLFSTIRLQDHIDSYQAEVILSALIGITVSVTQLGSRPIESPSPPAKLLEATLAALAAMTKEKANFAHQLAVAGRLSQFKCASDDVPMITTLLRLVRNRSNSIRLGSASCLTNLFRHGTIPRALHKEIALSVLPILVRLFDDVAQRSQASCVLTDLVKDSDDMQKAACEAGAIQRLSAILQSSTDVLDEGTVESALTALAAITLHKDEYRKQVIDAKVVPLIVTSMSHPSPAIRAAACQCARSLSRSVAMLRSSLVDAGVATAVMELMSDANLSVKTSATAAVCNLVLDFSPMRKIILDSGVLTLLGKLSQDENLELRLNAVWAVKHIVYAADTDIKETVLNEITPGLLLKLCDDPELSIQEQACEVIRNLVCGRPENIDLLIENIGIERLADFLIRKLSSNVPEIVISGIYSVVHIAAGSERHRMILMQRGSILEVLHRHLASEVEEIRIGAVWTIINLTWQEDEMTASERRVRVNALESLGFKHRLRELESDRSLDVRERVKTALAQMQ